MLKFFVPQRRTPNPRYAIRESSKDLSGKTVVFTGGTDGMGRVAVEMLHEMGAEVIVLGRDEHKSEAVLQKLTTAARGGSVDFEVCDLASMHSVRACARRILAQDRRIDILVNCAGAHIPERIVTEEGFEMNWAVNYLGPFLLTRLLLGRIRESAPSRIVNLCTDIAWLDHLDFDDLQSEHDFSATDAYTKGKLAMAMFTRELGERLEGTGVTANCLNPGFIRTNLLRNLTGIEAAIQPITRMLASPTVVGADRVVRLAVSPQYKDVTGTYVFEDTAVPPHRDALDAAKRERLMQVTEAAVSAWM